MGGWSVLVPMVVYFGIAWGSVELGAHLGCRAKKRSTPPSQESVAPSVTAILGLLALVLAFAFGHSASRFEERRHMLVEDTNAIGTYYLRTDLLDASRRRAARELLLEYVDIRTKGLGEDAELLEALARTSAIQSELWSISMDSDLPRTNAPLFTIYLTSLNAMIDVHGKRVAVALRHRIPTSLWIGFFLISSLSFFAIGYQAGALRETRPAMSIPLALAMALLIGMIWDLEQPMTVLAHVDSSAMHELRDTIASWLTRTSSD